MYACGADRLRQRGVAVDQQRHAMLVAQPLERMRFGMAACVVIAKVAVLQQTYAAGQRVPDDLHQVATRTIGDRVQAT